MPSTSQRRAEQPLGGGEVAGSRRCARIRVEIATSPPTSTAGTTSTSTPARAPCARNASVVPARPRAVREVVADDDRARAQRVEHDVVDERVGRELSRARA